MEVGVGSDENRGTRPAVLVVAGIEGNDLVGPVTAVSWVERLMKQYRDDAPTAVETQNLASLLKTTTIYVVPCLNPDGIERYFLRPQIELSGNNVPRDDDHDGLIDEDPCEDLNGDGLITMMRVEDKEGEYYPGPEREAAAAQGRPTERGEGYLAAAVGGDRQRSRWTLERGRAQRHQLQSELPLQLRVFHRRGGSASSLRGRDAGPGRFRRGPSKYRHRSDLRGGGQPSQDPEGGQVVRPGQADGGH